KARPAIGRTHMFIRCTVFPGFITRFSGPGYGMKYPFLFPCFYIKSADVPGGYFTYQPAEYKKIFINHYRRRRREGKGFFIPSQSFCEINTTVLTERWNQFAGMGIYGERNGPNGEEYALIISFLPI